MEREGWRREDMGGQREERMEEIGEGNRKRKHGRRKEQRKRKKKNTNQEE